MGRPRLNKSKSDANKEYLKKYRDNERKKKKLQTLKCLKPIKHKEHLEKDRMRKKEYRERKKQQEQQSQQQNNSNGSSATSSSTQCAAAFTTKEPLQRSVNKVQKLLPKSPWKKTEMIKDLASKYKLRIQFNSKKRGRIEKVINDEPTAYLDEFFERPDITYINPGRKDHVYLGKVDGEKTYAQKRYLLRTLRELFEILNGEEKNPYKFTFKQMYKYIKTKKQLILQGNIPDTSCLCEVCENSCLIAKTLRGLKKATLPTLTS